MKRSRTGSFTGEVLASPPVATVQLPLPLLDVLPRRAPRSSGDGAWVGGRPEVRIRCRVEHPP
jgi:hypothetical protein